MIGLDIHDNGGTTTGPGTPQSIADAWEDLSDLWNDAIDFVADLAQAVYGWVETVIEVYRWVRVVVQEIYGVPMDQWIAHDDERTCPECGALDGQVWERDSGEYPPAHNNCRCTRAYAYTDWRTREVVTWERQRDLVSIWTWQITGWA